MKYFFFSFMMLLLFACNNNAQQANNDKQAISLDNNLKINEFEKIMDSLQRIIPTIDGNQTFSFSNFSDKIRNWRESQTFIEIDSNFLKNYLDKPKPFGVYENDYCTNYFYTIIDFKDNSYHLIILRYIHNNVEAYMYLVKFDKQGNRKKEMILASYSDGPDWSCFTHSTIQGNKIRIYDYAIDDDIVKNDTTTVIWE